MSIPVLDLSLREGHREQFDGAVRAAAHDVGFFYLTGHGLPQARVDEVLPPGAPDWVDAPPLPGAFIVNLGEMLDVGTDGYLHATEHRVVNRSSGADRISVPYFFNPAVSARMPHLPLPADLRTGVTVDPDNPIFDTYGENAWKSRLRAHPDVAARHYPQTAS